MKKLFIVLIVTLLATGLSFAKDAPKSSQLDIAAKNLLMSLKSDNAGVRNSALYQIAKIRAQYPDYDLSKVEKEVEKVAQKDKSAIVRVNANLVDTVLNDKVAESQVNLAAAEPQEFFTDLYNSIYYPDKDF